MPPHRVTLARGRVVDHLMTSSRSICSAIERIAGLETLMALMKSLSRWISRFCSFIWNCCSLSSRFISLIFCCCECIRPRSSLTQLWFFSSSLGMMRLHPCSQGIGLLGLNSHSSRCTSKLSSLTIDWQPYITLSQLTHRRANRFLKIRGTARNCADVIGVRSNGQFACRVIHSLMHTRQNACSQVGACWNINNCFQWVSFIN